MTVRATLLTSHLVARSITRIHPMPLVVQFSAVNHVVVRFAVNALQLLSITYLICSILFRMKASVIKMRERSTNRAAEHFSTDNRIYPAHSTVLIGTGILRVMIGATIKTGSVANLIWKKTPAEGASIITRSATR